MPNLNHIAGGGGEWFREERSPLFQTLVSDVKQIISYPLSLHHKGYEEVERFMKERIDENGTLYSYATASFYMIYAFTCVRAFSSIITDSKGYSWDNILYMEDGKRGSLAKLSFNRMGYSFTQLCVTRGPRSER